MGARTAAPKPLAPFPCSFVGCMEEAVCGLSRKNDPHVLVNVCKAHFQELKGRPFPAKAP